MKRILLASTILMSMASNALAELSLADKIEMAVMRESARQAQLQEERPKVFHETLEELTFTGRQYQYYKRINEALANEGLMPRNFIPSALIGALVDFDADGFYEAAIQDRNYCEWDGCDTYFIKVNEGKVEIMDIINLTSLKYGFNSETQKYEMFVYQNSYQPIAYSIENGRFVTKDENFQESIEFDSLANAEPELKKEWLETLTGYNYNFVGSQLITQLHRVLYAQVDMNGDGRDEMLIAFVNSPRFCDTQDTEACDIFVYTNSYSPENFVLRGYTSQLLAGRIEPEALKPLLFRSSDSKEILYTYDILQRQYKRNK